VTVTDAFDELVETAEPQMGAMVPPSAPTPRR